MPIKSITPKVINYSQHITFQCLLEDMKIVLNYLEQYNGKPFESSDFLPPINASKMEWIKDFLQAALNHIKAMEDEGIIFI